MPAVGAPLTHWKTPSLPDSPRIPITTALRRSSTMVRASFMSSFCSKEKQHLWHSGWSAQGLRCLRCPVGSPVLRPMHHMLQAVFGRRYALTWLPYACSFLTKVMVTVFGHNMKDMLLKTKASAGTGTYALNSKAGAQLRMCRHKPNLTLHMH